MSDVCLVLEGTYPYVTGGVSSWVHNLIRSLPRVRFSLLTILPSHETYREYQYEVPENVVSVSEVFIHDYALSDDSCRGSKRDIFDLVETFYRSLPQRDYSLLPELFARVMDRDTRTISPTELFLHKRTWRLVQELYEALELEESFVDFFWTWRYSHLPLLRLADARIPRASLYHTISTGYAGLMAAFARIKTGAPVLLTEHGIYSNERRIEIEQARWIYERRVDSAVITDTVSPFKQIWITLFDHLSRITYEHSDEIITLYEQNRKTQIMGGADPTRSRVIPNGINLSNFTGRKRPRAEGEPYLVGFVGRVVSIKDVKTFVRACAIVHRKFPEARFPIMGPTEEEQDYFEECESLVAMLGLQQVVTFTGRVDVRKEYPRMDIIVLTSISEAQPLVILEANVSGVPCIATDVGACSELLDGRTPEDRALGASGLITPIASPEATAAAIVALLSDDGRRERMGAAGIERVQKFYDERDLNFAYLDLYRRHIRDSENRWRA